MTCLGRVIYKSALQLYRQSQEFQTARITSPDYYPFRHYVLKPFHNKSRKSVLVSIITISVLSFDVMYCDLTDLNIYL